MGTETMKLMLVDDEERFLSSMVKLLNKKGYKDVITASNGREALEKLRLNPIQVVILDVKMPEMDGNITLREIKRQYPMVEVIMLTGHATVESAIDGLKSGASDYLIKPTDIDELVQKAEAAFARRQDLEEKIRVARMRKVSQSARTILEENP